MRCAVPSSAPPLGGSRRVRRLEWHAWCIKRCLAYRAQARCSAQARFAIGGRSDGDQPHGFVRRACDGARARTTRWFGFFRRLGQLSLLRRGRGWQGRVRLQRPRPTPTADRSRVFSARRLPLRRPRQVRRTRSARRPARSVRPDLCGCSLAFALTSWRSQEARPARCGCL